ncbi:hypothetical protein Brsp05_03447 [Brucella sp. NBRC 12953]|uniref:cache domain-containing protein n=1 Tax=Brucella sp. NBRC 12953 TaxID=3075481 RepID=UPI000DE4AF1C
MTYSGTIYDENHQFDGFILVLVNEHYLYKFLKRFEEQPDMVLGLVDRDGIIRASNYGFAIGRNLKNYIEKELRIGQGVQIRGSEMVDHRLIIAYYKSSAAPLWANAGFPGAPFQRDWLLTTAIVMSALLALFTLLVAYGILLKKYLSSQTVRGSKASENHSGKLCLPLFLLRKQRRLLEGGERTGVYA